MLDIEAFLKQLTTSPGVYQYYNADGDIIYVGKAKNLKKRVSNYFQREHDDSKTRVLVKQIADIHITVTNTETEALVLETNLIKQHRPRYNILFRDDKSYPYVYISKEQFPRMMFYRGNRKLPGKFYGPFPSSGAVYKTLNTLQKVFKIRQCEPHFFAHRTRPCLQYQIGRCSAPCVRYISEQEYADSIAHVHLFLQGKSHDVMMQIAEKMDQASEVLDFETAANYRDQLQALQTLQAEQAIKGELSDMADIIAVVGLQGTFCVQVMMVREGAVLGSKTFFPKIYLAEDEQTVLHAFVSQFYTTGMGAQAIPKTIIAEGLPETELVAYLETQSGRKVQWVRQPKGRKLQWLQLAKRNAEHAVTTHLSSKKSMHARFVRLQEVLGLAEPPKRIECFDISHSHGESTVASCVVCGHEGAIKSDYRRFNITVTNQGDDYAALYEAITRRYQRLLNENKSLPEVILIDGGKGQLQQAIKVMRELGIHDVILMGVSKGPTRKAGMEQLWLPGESQPMQLDSHDSALHLIQQVRDEAHRFAISGHRARRDKTRKTSSLQDIPGIGPKRRQALLRHFGGWQQMRDATVEEIAKVPGMSVGLAKQLKDSL